MIYDADGNTVELGGSVIERATTQSKKQRAGKSNSCTREDHDPAFVEVLQRLPIAQLLHRSAAISSTIRGVQLPENREPNLCKVTELRDFIAARGGKITMNKAELVSTTKQ